MAVSEAMPRLCDSVLEITWYWKL